MTPLAMEVARGRGVGLGPPCERHRGVGEQVLHVVDDHERTSSRGDRTFDRDRIRRAVDAIGGRERVSYDRDHLGHARGVARVAEPDAGETRAACDAKTKRETSLADPRGTHDRGDATDGVVVDPTKLIDSAEEPRGLRTQEPARGLRAH